MAKERAMPKIDPEAELAGVVRYTHYSFLVFGHAPIPIVKWMREQADESMAHAQRFGEWITMLGAHRSLEIGPLDRWRSSRAK
jgi:bacterioferritin